MCKFKKQLCPLSMHESFITIFKKSKKAENWYVVKRKNDKINFKLYIRFCNCNQLLGLNR